MSADRSEVFVGSTLLDRERVLAYAAASGDFNSIHVSDEAGRSLGFDGAIAHGMLTLGWAVVRLVELLDFSSLRTVSAKFVAPVPVGARVRLFVDSPRIDPLEPLKARVLLDNDTPVLEIELSLSDLNERAPLPALEGEIVAECLLGVDREVAVKFARAVGVTDDIFTSDQAAVSAGFASLPTVPTLAFALPGQGFLADDPVNEGVLRPDPVTDCEVWANTDLPVVHGKQSFTFERPLFAAERLRARTAIVGRSQRQRSNGAELQFTEVRTVFETESGEPIATSDMQLVVIKPAPQAAA